MAAVAGGAPDGAEATTGTHLRSTDPFPGRPSWQLEPWSAATPRNTRRPANAPGPIADLPPTPTTGPGTGQRYSPSVGFHRLLPGPPWNSLPWPSTNKDWHSAAATGLATSTLGESRECPRGRSCGDPAPVDVPSTVSTNDDESGRREHVSLRRSVSRRAQPQAVAGTNTLRELCDDRHVKVSISTDLL